MCKKNFLHLKLFLSFEINKFDIDDGSEYNSESVNSFGYCSEDNIKFLWYLSWKNKKFYDVLLLTFYAVSFLFGKRIS